MVPYRYCPTSSSPFFPVFVAVVAQLFLFSWLLSSIPLHATATMSAPMDYFAKYGPDYNSLLNKPLPLQEFKRIIRAYSFQCSNVPAIQINNNKSRSTCKVFQCPKCDWSIRVYRLGPEKVGKEIRPFCLRTLKDITPAVLHPATCPASLVHTSVNTLQQSAVFQSLSSASCSDVQKSLENSGVPVALHRSEISVARVHSNLVQRQQAFGSYERLPLLMAAIKTSPWRYS
jgi:hypothetical protein